MKHTEIRKRDSKQKESNLYFCIAVSVARKRLRLRMESDADLKQEVADMVEKLSKLKI